jgi:hypothetical protein
MASALFCLAGVTDLLDGWIARNFKVTRSVLCTIFYVGGVVFVLVSLFIKIKIAGFHSPPQ